MSSSQQAGQGGPLQLHPAAYRELQPGETYEPFVPADARPCPSSPRAR